MKRVLEPCRFFPVRDGTQIAPVLNSWDANAQARAVDTFAGASLAVGEIPPQCASRPHLHPLVAQVTWVLDGRLRVRMKEPSSPDPYELELGRGAGVLTEPMTFLQLVFDASWDELARDGFSTLAISDRDAIRLQRASAQDRLRAAASSTEARS
jgi:hypothetical protein